MSMKPLIGIAVLLLSLTASGQTSMKGYELYSWKHKGTWYYSLLPGTNRIKSYDEITSPRVSRKGTSGLLSELKRLPKGEQVLWRSDAPAGSIRSSSPKRLDLKQPSRDRIKHIIRACEKLGIKLTLT